MTLSTKALITLLAGTLILRSYLYLFNYPDPNTVDPSLEYLVASHIIKHGEFPLVGTTAFEGKAPINSPLYYYFLAVPLMLWNSIFTLNALNIAMQGLMAFTIWEIVRRVLGIRAAFLSVLFISLSAWGMRSSRFFFQPYVMQPLFMVSIALLVQAWLSRKLGFLLGSVAAFVAATGLYLSSVAYIPVYIIGVLIVLRRLPAHANAYRKTAAVAACCISLAFGSVAWSLAFHRSFTLNQFSELLTPTLPQYLQGLQTYARLYGMFLFPYPGTIGSISLSQLMMGLLYFFSAFVILRGKAARERNSILAVLALSLIPLLIMPIFSLAPSEHYLHLALGFGSIVTALVLSDMLSAHHPLLRIAAAALAGFMLFSQSDGFRWEKKRPYPAAQQAAELVRREIALLPKRGDSKPTYAVYTFKVQQVAALQEYSLNYGYFFWHLLEEKTGSKLVSTDIYKGLLILPEKTDYLFVSCVGLSREDQQQARSACAPYIMERMPYVPLRSISTHMTYPIILFVRDETAHRFLVLGNEYFAQQQFQKAADAYASGVMDDPMATELLNGLGNAHIKLNQLTQAQEAFTRSLAHNPENSGAYTGLGRVSYTRGEYAQAERFFLTAIRLNPHDTGAYFDLGKLYRVLRRHDDSQQAFTRALQINPRDTGMLFGISYLYMQYRQFDSAEQVLRQGLAIDPTYAGLYAALGDLYLRMRRYEESERYYTKALEVDPNTDLYTGLAELYVQTRQFSLAEETIHKAIAINPKADRFQGLGNLYLQMGRLDDAIIPLQKAIAINPQGNGYIGLGNVYLQQGNYDLAEETFKRCLETPFKAQAWLALGSMYMNANRYGESERYLLLATTDDEIKPRAYISLGDLYAKIGRTDEARKAYLTFKQLDPSSPEGDQRLMELQ